jgi:hypothetical protein
MRTFQSHGAVASESLIRAFQRNPDSWAQAVLSQSFRIPKEYRDALMAGEAEWKITNRSTITIGLAKT